MNIIEDLRWFMDLLSAKWLWINIACCVTVLGGPLAVLWTIFHPAFPSILRPIMIWVIIPISAGIAGGIKDWRIEKHERVMK